MSTCEFKCIKKRFLCILHYLQYWYGRDKIWFYCIAKALMYRGTSVYFFLFWSHEKLLHLVRLFSNRVEIWMKCRCCFVFVLFKKLAALRMFLENTFISRTPWYKNGRRNDFFLSDRWYEGQSKCILHLQRTEHKNVTQSAINLRFIQLLKPLIF